MAKGLGYQNKNKMEKKMCTHMKFDRRLIANTSTGRHLEARLTELMYSICDPFLTSSMVLYYIGTKNQLEIEDWCKKMNETKMQVI